MWMSILKSAENTPKIAKNNNLLKMKRIHTEIQAKWGTFLNLACQGGGSHLWPPVSYAAALVQQKQNKV